MDWPTSVDEVDLDDAEYDWIPDSRKKQKAISTKIKECIVARVDMSQFKGLRFGDFVLPTFQAALDKKLNPPPQQPNTSSTSRSRGGSAASTGTPANTRNDEEAVLEMLARLQQRLAGTECDIDGDDHFARLARENLGQRLLKELRSSSDRVDRLLEGGRLASTRNGSKERGELLVLVAPFGQSQYGVWKLDFKEHHGVEPTVDDIIEWLQGQIEAQDYVDAATRETWSEAIGAVQAVTTKLATPTPENPMVGRGRDCEGCQWILAALERRSDGKVNKRDTDAHPCTCATRPAPESVTLEPTEKLWRTADAMTDKLKELAVDYLNALKRDGKLEEHLRARAVFVVGGNREKLSVTSRRWHQLNPEHIDAARILGHAAQRRIGLSPDRYCLAERNLDPFSRRCRVVEGKLKTTRRIREFEDFKVDSDDDAATVPTGSTGMYDHEIGFEA